MELTADKRKKLELEAQKYEASNWSWLEDAIQTRPHRFIDEIGNGPLGRSWVFLCEGNSLRESGEFFTDEIAGRLVLICRTEEGKLKGFMNVCPHLGAPVERRRVGRSKSFVCPYHAWVFSLDGRLTGVAMPEGYEGSGFRKEEFALVEIRMVEIGSLVFGCLSPESEPAGVYFEMPQPYVADLFPAGSGFEIIFDYRLRADLGWEEWMTRSRRAFESGAIAEALLGIAPSEYLRRRRLASSSAGHQVVELPGMLDVPATLAGSEKASRPSGKTDRVIHLAPNLMVASVGDSLVTLRPDPLDSTLSWIRAQGYGVRGESETVRRARLRQMQLWWGPYSEVLRVMAQ